MDHEWIKRSEMMPERCHADENQRVYAADNLQVQEVTLLQFERNEDFQYWMPRPRRVKPPMPERVK